VSSKKKVDEIARLQRRTVASVESKLKSIAAQLYFNEDLPYEEVEVRTGIKKEALIVRRMPGASTGSPKTVAALEPIARLEPVAGLEPVAALELVQVITTQSPFSLETLSTLLISSVSCLLTPS